MYEVEKNFNLSSEEKDRLLRDAVFVNQKTIVDVYYDSMAFDLTRQDIWLRKRGEGYEVKMPADPSRQERSRQAKHYLEIEDEDEIRRTLSLSFAGGMEDAIRLAGYSLFCRCTTMRASYVKQDFNIVIDHVTYDGADWSYDTSEIECLVQTVEAMPQAADKITAFARQHGLKAGDVPGKVIEYLRRDRPTHYAALVQAGTVIEDRA